MNTVTASFNTTEKNTEMFQWKKNRFVVVVVLIRNSKPHFIYDGFF